MIIRLLGPAILLITGAAMLWWSWGTWPDPQVDFGRELYVAWRLSEGEALYRDIAHVMGPLSPYLNALWFHLFGASLLTLVLCNLAILAGLTALSYQLLADLSSEFAATIACVVLLMVFAFGQFVEIGNYNFICPYRHELTHGLTLSLAALVCLSAYLKYQQLPAIAGVGSCIGLLSLTKIEVFLAAVLAIAAGLGLAVWAERPARRRLAGLLMCLTASAVVPPLLAFLLLLPRLSPAAALQGILGMWLPVATFATSPFYRVGMGLDNLRGNLAVMLNWTGWYALLFGSSAGVSFLLRAAGKFRFWFMGAFSSVVALMLGNVGAGNVDFWLGAVRPLPLVMGIAAVWCWVGLQRQRGNLQSARRMIMALATVLFASGLLGKILLNARVYHYGFALAMPATLLLVVALVEWIPQGLSRRGGDGLIFRAVALTVLAIAVTAHLQMVGRWFGRKRYVVAHGPDVFRSDVRGALLGRALEAIAQHVKPQQALLVLPEGLMLNYLSRRASPNPYGELMPTELAFFGEDQVLAAIQANPPDYVVLVHKDTSEYGAQFFGRDYGRRISTWVQDHYGEVALIGDPPFQHPRHFGIALMRRVVPGPS